MANILITVPSNQLPQSGNCVTADRWADMLRKLRHTVTIQGASAKFEKSYDLLIAMHAKHSANAIAAVRRQSLPMQIVVVMTGTDLYRDLCASKVPKRSMDQADRVVVLQDQAIHQVPAEIKRKVFVIFQSATMLKNAPAPLKRSFEISVSANLRSVKDPFRTELASRQLPADSRISISHSGFALSESMADQALLATAKNRRYRWLGGLPRWKARRLVARSQALVVSSKMEGGANVISEALVNGVPVLASRVSGNVGMLGEDYSGYYDFGNTAELSALLSRFETDVRFRRDLRKECRQRAKLFTPHCESAALKELLHVMRVE